VRAVPMPLPMKHRQKAMHSHRLVVDPTPANPQDESCVDSFAVKVLLRWTCITTSEQTAHHCFQVHGRTLVVTRIDKEEPWSQELVIPISTLTLSTLATLLI
jgi:hypothetical protein